MTGKTTQQIYDLLLLDKLNLLQFYDIDCKVQSYSSQHQVAEHYKKWHN